MARKPAPTTAHETKKPRPTPSKAIQPEPDSYAVAVALRKFLSFVETLDRDANRDFQCPADRPTLDAKWSDVCHTVNEARRRLIRYCPTDENGMIVLNGMNRDHRELWDTLTGAIITTALTRYAPDGRLWEDAINGSADVPPIWRTVVEADRVRKLCAIADLLDPPGRTTSRHEIPQGPPGETGGRKPGGWTRKELVEEAKVTASFSNSSFDRVRVRAGVSPSERGGVGQQRRFSNAELRKLISALEAGVFRKKHEVASAWRGLLRA